MSIRMDLRSQERSARAHAVVRSPELRFEILPLLLALAGLGCVSCGVSSSGGPLPPASVSVDPPMAQIFTGDQVAFTARVNGVLSSAFTWQVNGMTGGDAATVGAIAPNGLYTAPPTVPPSNPVTVTAVLQADPTSKGSASVTIKSLSSIQSLSVSPLLSSVTTSQSLQLQVTTAGVSNSMVNWSASGGTINATGLYTPPSTPGVYTIIASLIANPSAVGSAHVAVTDFAGTFTWRNDNSRSGQNQKELALAPATVSSSKFGKLFSCPLDGQAYAAPLYVANLPISGQAHNVVFAATEKDTVFAFDADASPCHELWKTPTSLVPAGEQAVPAPNLQITSNAITPFIGITGTPVIDPVSSTLYVVAKTETTDTINPVYRQRLFALDLATGQPQILPNGIEIATPLGVFPAFSPLLGNQRAALLLDQGTVYIAFASHGDQGDYHGWVLGYDASTLQQTAVFDAAPGAGAKGGIWQSGGGPSADLNGNIFAITGNGVFDVNLSGLDYADSFLKLSTVGGLAVTDFFTSCNQAILAKNDQDLGSSAPVLLPDGAGPALNPNLILGAAKDGSIYLVDRDVLGGYAGGGVCAGTPPPPVQILPVGDGPILSTPLFWNNTVFVAAGNGKLKAFAMSGGVLTPGPTSQSPESFGSQGATPVVSAKGASNAVVWLIDSSGALASPNTPAILRAFDAANLSNEIYNSAMMPARDAAGPAVKFTVPTVANGKVYVGTQTELDVYGLLP